MKTKGCKELFLDSDKFFMVRVTVFWPAEDEHLNLAELVDSIETPDYA